MRLNENNWVLAGGTTPQWRWLSGRRAAQSVALLRRLRETFIARAPASVQKRRYLSGLDYFLDRPGSARDRICLHPCFDYWLYLGDQHFSRTSRPQDWHIHFGLFQGFAGSLAMALRDSAEFDAVSDPRGRFYFYGTPFYLEGEPATMSRAFKVCLRRGQVSALASRAPALKRMPEILEGLYLDDRNWLTKHGITTHGSISLKAATRDRFVAVLRAALADLSQAHPELFAEMTDMVRLIVPLANPLNHGSVSSSYVNLRGAICLSHSEDPLLQAETLIHEFCHQKMNQLLAADPILWPGQSGQVFYSPWRDDARRLRGLLLGAHAFLNVSSYLAGALKEGRVARAARTETMANVARRLDQCDTAVATVRRFGSLTEFGARFLGSMHRELQRLRRAARDFPRRVVKEQEALCRQHRLRFSVVGTGIHR